MSGSRMDAQAAGFTDCVNDWTSMRCSRHGVMLRGAGPYIASVDMIGGQGGGGFSQLTLWHETDQDAVFAIAEALKADSWEECFTGEGGRGDQAIYKREGASVRFAMDLSYWGKRRLRIIPETHPRKPLCTGLVD